VIDLHAHLLPGIDDGPPDMAGALALATAAVEAGTRVMAATPHVGLQFPVEPGELSGRVAELSAELERAGIALEVIAGGEIAPTRAHDLTDDELRQVALGGSHCLLLECPFTPAGDLMPRLVASLQQRGFRILLAHPERSPDLARRPDRVEALVAQGAFVQVTAGSFDGVFGRPVRRAALELLDRGLIHVVASDAHDAQARPPTVRAFLEATGVYDEHIDWLTGDAPRALLDDVEVPISPVLTAGRWRLWGKRP
jgi:protein-tyrosine phosphatase